VLVLDVNVVLAAYRGDHPHHADVRQWFDEMLAGGDDFAVPDAVWASFLRLATSHRIFEVPSTITDAFGFLEATVAQHGCVRAGPGPRHLTILRRLCEEAGAVGDLVPDAVVGAVAVEHGAEVVTLDRDFARFASVRHRRPGAAS